MIVKYRRQQGLDIYIGDAKVSWCAHHRGPLLHATHAHSDKDSLPATLFSEKTKEVWHEHQHPHKLLLVHHQELADGLHYSLVRELLCPQPQIESGGSGTAHHWQQSLGHLVCTALFT